MNNEASPFLIPSVGSSTHDYLVTRDPTPSFLLPLLTNPKTTTQEIQKLLFDSYNPEKFKQPLVVIGSEESLCTIESTATCIQLFEHLKNYGAFFPKIKFVKCKFSPVCFEIFLKQLGDFKQVKSLTFEGCVFSIDPLAKIDQLTNLVTPLCLLTDNLQELAITHCEAFTCEMLESLEVLLPLLPLLSTLKLNHNHLNDEMVTILAGSLKENIGIQTLILDFNRFTLKGATILAKVLKKHPALRSCSLVGNKFTLDQQKKLEDVIGKSPSPFVFAALPPSSAPAESRVVQDMISQATHYTPLQWELFTKLTNTKEKTHLFRRWLGIGFTFKAAPVLPDQNRGLSFFNAIALACGKNEWLNDQVLFFATINFIRKYIAEFTETILSDFKNIPEKISLADFFADVVLTQGAWPETTFRLAIQRVLKHHGIHRPIYIYTETLAPEITANGNLLPHREFRLEGAGNKPDQAICLYFDGQDTFELLEKRTP